MRIILYTGKGGVGKTSIAAVSAISLANKGNKVLVMSTDMAHSLSDSFDVKLSKEPKRVIENLDALEIDVVHEGEKSWSNLKGYLKQMLTAHGESSIEVEELLVFPGMEELFSLFKILDFYEEGYYDVIIVDCAPTGETLSLLKYPQMFADFLEKVLPVKKKGLKVAGPIVEKMIKIPMPKETVFDDIEYLMDKLVRLQELMLNKEVVSLRIVTTPEKIVIQEAKRNFTFLHLYNYNVDSIMVNRIYPEAAMTGYFNKWVQMQQEGLTEIEESFSEIPKFYLELQKGELRTLPVLEQVAHSLFDKTELKEVLFSREIFSVISEEGKKRIRILLPFADKDDMELRQSGNEIIISIKNVVRRFIVPAEFAELEIQFAKFEGEYLYIGFDQIE